jgi:hypothetical protein
MVAPSSHHSHPVSRDAERTDLSCKTRHHGGLRSAARGNHSITPPVAGQPFDEAQFGVLPSQRRVCRREETRGCEQDNGSHGDDDNHDNDDHDGGRQP